MRRRRDAGAAGFAAGGHDRAAAGGRAGGGGEGKAPPERVSVQVALAHLVHSVVHHDENIVRILDVGIANEHIHRGATASVGAVTAATTTFDANDALPVIRYVCDARLSAL